MKEIAFGNLSKMASRLCSPVEYEMVIGSEKVPLNNLLGKSVKLTFTGNIFCTHCGRKTKKSFNQGYCFPCFRKLASCDTCIMSPEKCHFSAGTCREPGWGEANCMIPHFVYLANSSGLKVGITRHSQVPTRWIDQGASQALPVFEVGSRRMSGLIEALFRSQVADRTNWRAMLKGEPEKIDLQAERDRLYTEFDREVAGIVQAEAESCEKVPDVSVTSLEYPVLEYPSKVTSLNPEKNPEVTGTLLGIKGQYLILDTGCINIRKFTAYETGLFV